MQYANTDKLNRARIYAKEHGKEGDEKAIKERYIALGGLIIGADEEETPTAFADMTVAKLKAKAKEMDIVLGDATTKDEIVAILTEATA